MLKLTLKAKFLGFGLLALTPIFILTLGNYLGNRAMDAAFTEYARSMDALRNHLQADQAHDSIRADMLAFFAAARTRDQGAMDSAKAELKQHGELLRGAFAEFEKTQTDGGARQEIAKTGKSLQAYLGSADAIVIAAGKDIGAAESRLPEFMQRFKALETEMSRLNELIERAGKNAKLANEESAASSLHMLLLLAICASVGLGLLCYFLARGVMRPLGGEPAYAMEVVKRIAAGDLVSEVVTRRGDDSSLLASMKTMQEGLRRTVSEIHEAAHTIAAASKQIASGNADLSSRTEEQASSLEETASSLEQLTSTVRQNAENARQANQLAAGASGVALTGGRVVGQVVQTMSSINESSKKIVDIISVIDGIAFQTNILALNAAVEAARAGEQGRGFAVVATEVRTLAQRSAAAAKEIKQLISDSVHKVDDGTRLVDEAGKTMDAIVASVTRVTDIMAEISAASQEQSSGIEQVNRAMTQMDQNTQQNAALVEQAAAAAESMQAQAGNLAQAVAVFKLRQDGDRSATPVNSGHPAASVTRLPARRNAGNGAVAEEAGPPATRARRIANASSGNEVWEEF